MPTGGWDQRDVSPCTVLTLLVSGVSPDGVELDEDVGDGAEEVAEDHDHRQLHRLDLGVRYCPEKGIFVTLLKVGSSNSFLFSQISSILLASEGIFFFLDYRAIQKKMIALIGPIQLTLNPFYIAENQVYRAKTKAKTGAQTHPCDETARPWHYPVIVAGVTLTLVERAEEENDGLT